MCPVICPHLLEGYDLSGSPPSRYIAHPHRPSRSPRLSARHFKSPFLAINVGKLHPPRATRPSVFHPGAVRRWTRDGLWCVHTVTTCHRYHSPVYFHVSDLDNHAYGHAPQPACPLLDIAFLPQESSPGVFFAVPTPPRQPQELCDIIIDERACLGNGHLYWNFDTWALKQCALVCRAWTPRAQLWLFRYVALGSVDSLRKLEAQLCLREEYVPEIEAIRIFIADRRGYPICNLAHAVTTLARRCSKLHALQVFGAYNGGSGESSKFHPFLPFHSRIHSALYRQSFSTLTNLRLVEIRFHSDTDFLRLILSFPALSYLYLWNIHFNILERVKEHNYILLLKNRKGSLGRLRFLEMVGNPDFEPEGSREIH